MSDAILVTGATGFIGQAVVPILLARGCHVRAVVRPASTIPFPEHPHLELLVGDVTDADSLVRAARGIRAVVHLAAAKSDEPDSEAINVGGATNLIRACQANDVPLMINVSTQSAKLRRPGLYGRTKAQADALFQSSGLAVITLRPSLVYGDLTSGVFGSLIRFTKLPIIPVIGSGAAPFCPIHREDLAVMIERLLHRDDLRGQTYDVGGPTSLSLNALLEQLQQVQGVRRPILHIPIGLASMLTRALSVLPRPPITISNVRGAAESLTMDVETLPRELNVQPRDLVRGLQDLFAQCPAAPSAEDQEAAVLLRYVCSASGIRWQPGPQEIARYQAALRAHGISASHRLDPAAWHWPRLGWLDTATRWRWPQCVLQQKLLIAAAIVEAHPVSSSWLLPRKRSLIGVLFATAQIIIRMIGNVCGAVACFCVPGFVVRNAGRI